MGYPMALNLRKGMEKDRTLFICDVSEEAIGRFQKETESQGPVKVVSNGWEAAKAAVCYPFSLPNA